MGHSTIGLQLFLKILTENEVPRCGYNALAFYQKHEFLFPVLLRIFLF